MASNYSVKFTKIIKEFNLEKVWAPDDVEEIFINTNEVNRPGLQLAGFYELFDPSRVQIIGKTEYSYLKNLGAKMYEALDAFLSKKPMVIVITWNLTVDRKFLELAQKYNVPIYRTSEMTSEFVAGITQTLSVALAKRITRHGVLVEVYGEGVLILGDSGVGKSETALELIKRGHRLIADDAVEIRRVSNKTLVGSAPDNIRHFIELRGVGVLNARRLFGMGAVKLTEKIDMVVQLELWDSEKVYDRLGLENEYTDILGINVPITTVPVKPGRNLSIIIEAAAMNNRQKKMGYNAARELLHSLGMTDDIIPAQKELEFWHHF